MLCVGAFFLFFCGIVAIAQDQSDLRKQQTQAWSSFYKGKLVEARNTLLPLMQSKHQDVHVEAVHCYARICFAEGSQRGKTEALKLWKGIENKSTTFAHQTRMQIAKSLQLAEGGKLKEAERILDPLLGKEHQTTATSEAALVYAEVLIELRNYKRAAIAASFAEGFLKSKAGRELGESIAPFVDAAKSMKKRVQNASRKRPKTPKPTDKAEVMFKKAEAHRAKKQYASAMNVYLQIMEHYSSSPFAPRSELHTGHCWLGSGNKNKAISTWEEFIRKKPIGPWRGQAYIELIDLALEKLDLSEAVQHVQLAERGVNNLSPDHSWKIVRFELAFRFGAVHYISGDFSSAAEAFQSAIKSASGRQTGSLNKLLQAADNKSPLIPTDCIGDKQTPGTTALSLAMLFHLIGKNTHADTFLSCLPRQVTPIQRSFGCFLKGSILQTANKLPQAITQYEVSLKTAKTASFHDETLYRLASITERLAKKAHPAPKLKAVKSGEAHSDLAAQKIKAQKAAEKKRQAALAAAQSKAAPYWKEIVTRYSKTDVATGKFSATSPHVELALYRLALIRYWKAEQLDSTNTWREAVIELKKFTSAYPKSLWAGDAFVRQIDAALEGAYDVPLGIERIKDGLVWAEALGLTVETRVDGALSDRATDEAAKAISEWYPKLPLWGSRESLGGRTLLDKLYNLYLRAGILAYVQEDYDGAEKHFQAAGPARPTDGMQGSFDKQKFGLHSLAICCRRKEPAWHKGIAGSIKVSRNRLLLKLADTYLHAGRLEKAESIYRLFTKEGSKQLKVDLASESYSRLRLALTLSQDQGNASSSIEIYKSYYQSEHSKYPWTADAILMLGVLIQNTERSPSKAMNHYKYVYTHFPKHPEAERAMYFHCLGASLMKDTKLVMSISKDFLEKYPDSQWYKAVQSFRTKGT